MSVGIARLRTEVKNKERTCPLLGVMAGLVPAIHVFNRSKDVDPRNTSGDDAEGGRTRLRPPGTTGEYNH
jgi:hypothetical protein